jgi:hypothetical protein
MKALLVALIVLVSSASTVSANPNHTAICTPSNPVQPEDVVISGSGYRADAFYTVRFAQDGEPYSAAVAHTDAAGDFSLSMESSGISYPLGTTDVSVNDQPGSKLRILATCSFTAS